MMPLPNFLKSILVAAALLALTALATADLDPLFDVMGM